MFVKLSKSLMATVLVLCMLLSVVPVLGATIDIPNMPITEINVPAEGLSLKTSAVGVNGTNWKMVISNTYTSRLGISHSYTSETWVNNNGSLEGSAYYGLVLSGKTKLSDEDFGNALEGKVVEFTFTNVPLSRVSYRSGNAMSLCLSYEDLANRKYVSGVKIKDAEGNIVDYDGALTSDNFKYNGSSYAAFSAPSEFRIDRGTWSGYIQVDTGAFPENTIFIATNNMTKVDSANAYVETQAGLTYNVNAEGDFGVYVPKVSGKYYVYGLRSHYASGDTGRTSKVFIATNTIEHNVLTEEAAYSVFSGSVGSSSTATGCSFFWCADANNSVYTLTKDVPFIVRRHKGANYDRLAGLALVPAKLDGTNPMLDVDDSAWTYADLPDQTKLEKLEGLTAGQIKNQPVIVTVNGVSTTVPAFAARIKGYDYTDESKKINRYDLKGCAVSSATVFDALLTATSPVAGNTDGYMPYDVTTDGITLGGLSKKYAVVVNGKTCLNIDQMLIKNGDVIETKAFAPDNFVPLLVGFASDDPKLMSGLSNAGSSIGIQYGLNSTTLTNYGILSNNNYAALDGCMLTGYLSPRNTTRWTSVAPNLDFNNSKVYFDGVRLMYRGSSYYYYAIESDRQKVTITSSAEEALVGNGTVHHPYKITTATNNVLYDYTAKDLWLVNNQTQNNVVLDVDKSNGRFSLTTDGSKLVTLFIITYAEDGSIEEKEIKNDVYISWTTPYIGEVNANQTIYVWNAKALEGTAMIPLTAPISMTSK